MGGRRLHVVLLALLALVVFVRLCDHAGSFTFSIDARKLIDDPRIAQWSTDSLRGGLFGADVDAGFGIGGGRYYRPVFVTVMAALRAITAQDELDRNVSTPIFVALALAHLLCGALLFVLLRRLLSQSPWGSTAALLSSAMFPRAPRQRRGRRDLHRTHREPADRAHARVVALSRALDRPTTHAGWLIAHGVVHALSALLDQGERSRGVVRRAGHPVVDPC